MQNSLSQSSVYNLELKIHSNKSKFLKLRRLEYYSEIEQKWLVIKKNTIAKSDLLFLKLTLLNNDDVYIFFEKSLIMKEEYNITVLLNEEVIYWKQDTNYCSNAKVLTELKKLENQLLQYSAYQDEGFKLKDKLEIRKFKIKKQKLSYIKKYCLVERNL
ncbi:MSC_0621 family F1-like ATPase epsilon subunit [Mycoplasmopsis agassizii]|uniref:MSC_0621 family F1-like ATPase epsilon subunit n=1 Tax=Mycoplasmopsis agassizii TaxID=33922 RepID=UPI0035278084